MHILQVASVRHLKAVTIDLVLEQPRGYELHNIPMARIISVVVSGSGAAASRHVCVLAATPYCIVREQGGPRSSLSQDNICEIKIIILRTMSWWNERSASNLS